MKKIKSLQEKIINSYFQPKPFERFDNGRIYELLGVRHFKKILPITGDYMAKWIGCKPLANASSKEEGLKDYKEGTIECELIHTLGLPILGGLYSIVDVTGSDYGNILFNIGLNLAINVYPIMVQRYNRTRVCTILEKMEQSKIKLEEKILIEEGK